ncbi:EF-hand domain-containing protein [Agaribacterium haliotis]|uniref:EF-hand domain-containing protein n=1 Tax=Agaribacterium haliotis TaxID=2013869 RepID=UPI001EFD8845|nr:hypothetical protein [Agaribacterium haliotis]
MLILSMHVLAEGLSAEDQRLLARYDANGDRVISADEVELKRKQAFERMDIDADGEVSFIEYEELDHKKRLPLLKARFDKLDQDQDGRLSGDEYASYLGSFERMDHNGDGQVSGDEISQPENSETAQLKPEADACFLWLCVRGSLD